MKATIPTAQTSVNLTEQGDTLKFYNTDQTSYYNLPPHNFIYNNCCLVATVSKGEKVMMFTGDIYSGAQQTIASTVPKVCIMLDPHHGDMGEISHEFFEKHTPKSVSLQMEMELINLIGSVLIVVFKHGTLIWVFLIIFKVRQAKVLISI